MGGKKIKIDYEEVGFVAGVDEVGRGPLAGPVVAAAVILNPKRAIRGLNDSKQLTAAEREKLYQKICTHALAWAVGRAEVHEIDKLNIFQANLLAMQRAIFALEIVPNLILVDGKHCPKTSYPSQAIVGGDGKVAAIGAASILAKVTRDAEMQYYNEIYPGYGFANHKGYSTAEHLQAIKRIGVSPIHRKSFAPVYEASIDQLDMFLSADTDTEAMDL